MTACAIGAATRPPVAFSATPLWSSTMTATAIFGASAGAKAMSHAWAWFGVPVCAVPVLAATVMPGIGARVAVPRRATSIIICLSTAAVAPDVAVRHSLGL